MLVEPSFRTRKDVIKTHQVLLFLIDNCFPWLVCVILISFGGHFEK